jgi:hypothetical protein
MNFRWAKSVPTFLSLARDQLTLLESSWPEFFVLGAAQFNLPIHLGAKFLGGAVGTTTTSSSNNKSNSSDDDDDAETSSSLSPLQQLNLPLQLSSWSR